MLSPPRLLPAILPRLLAALALLGLLAFAVSQLSRHPYRAPGEAARAPLEPGEAASAVAEAEGGGDGAPLPSPVHHFARPVVPGAAASPAAMLEEAPPPAPRVAGGELGPDRLPLRALRCSRVGDAGAYQCGECRGDSDCPPGEGCVNDYAERETRCRRSECTNDSECGGGVCARVSPAHGLPVRLCLPPGLRGEGEPCELDQASRASSCQPGLLCALGVCRSLCDAGACPEEHACEEFDDGAACVPDCTRLGCPESQACRRLPDGTHLCLSQTAGDCNEKGCPEGERCNMRLHLGRGVFWCAPLCNPLLPGACAPGEVCGVGSPTVSTCYQDCAHDMGASCPTGWTCATVDEEHTRWGCMPSAFSSP